MKERTKNLLFSLAGALLVTLLCGKGLFQSLDMGFQDYLIQSPVYVPGDIYIVGITDDDLQKLGPYNSWDRNVMASALERLSSDPDRLPAVVAVDAVY